MQFSKKTNKTKRNIIILSVFLVIIGALIAVAVILSKNTDEPTEVPKTPIPILEEEGRYNSYPISYPEVLEKDIMLIRINNEEGQYAIGRPTKTGSFHFFYTDENGEEHSYYPDILYDEDEMLYDDLYAAVTGDGYDMIPMLTYLIAAIRAPIFDERIYLSDDQEERNRQLAAYGLVSEGMAEPGAEEKVKKTISFLYLDAEGNEKTHLIELGSNTITGSGFYFRVDNRDYVYVTKELNYFRYGLVGLEAFINPILVAAGLDNNSHALYAPYLTPEYKQWLNTVYREGSLPVTLSEMKSVSRIFADVNTFLPSYVLEDAKDEEITDSIEKIEMGEMNFALSDYKDNKLYSYLLSALAGQSVGDLELKQSLLEEVYASENSTYRYVIKEIEALVTTAGDNETVGVLVGDTRYVKVKYELYVNGEQKNVVHNQITNEDGEREVVEHFVLYHGIVDLDAMDKAGVDTSAIRACAVGDKPADLDLEITYKKTDDAGNPTGIAYKSARFYIDEILAVFEMTYDENGVAIDKEVNVGGKLTENSVIVYRYYYTMDGIAETAQIGTIAMKATEGEHSASEKAKIRTAIKKMWEAEVPKTTYVLTQSLFTGLVSDFVTYEFNNISSYWKSELKIGFSFVNASKRDPFYGESFYEKTNDTAMLYAVSQDACEKVVKVLGGIAETSKASGLVGIETIEVGVTEAALEKYGCYANTISFSLPRDMYVTGNAGEDELDDYAWTRSLKFVLHISDPVYDPDTQTMVRYVASELYDLIIKIEAKTLGFIDLDVVDFWGRRSMILIDSVDLEEIHLTLGMSDLSGKYKFTLTHSEKWYDQATNTEYDADTKPEDSNLGSYTKTEVRLWQYGASSFETAYEKYLRDTGRWNTTTDIGQGNLTYFYDYVNDTTSRVGKDSRGVAMFKEWILLMYFTQYTGTLTEEEQAAVLDPNGDGDTSDAEAPLMSFKVKLNNTNENSRTKRFYCYEFYRCDDRRVMVRIYETDLDGNVYGDAYASDFYISILAFRKIVSGFVGILNGEDVDKEDAYPDYMG